MNGYEIYNKAILRLGYNGSVNDRLIERFPELLNQITEDLKIDTVSDVFEEINTDKKGIEAICCGTAMLLALSESDGEKHKLYCELYNAKRAAFLAEATRVEDKLPYTESGDV